MAAAAPWLEMLTEQQRKILNAACGDLAEQIVWHGNRLDKDMLGGSSLKLTKKQCIDAITMAFHVGDAPHEQGLANQAPVRWGAAVCKARWLAQ